MKISSILNSEDSRFNAFIKYSNSFMSKLNEEPIQKSQKANTTEKKLDKTMGLETLTIFPKQVINGKTTIIA